MNLQQARYLKAMGYTVWARRGASQVPEPETAHEPTATPRADAVPAAPAEAPPRLLVVVDRLPDADQRALLDKILAAVGLDPAQCPVSDESHAPAARRLVFSDTQRPGPEDVVLPSLSRMQADVGAKKAAWAQLKPLVGRLG